MKATFNFTVTIDSNNVTTHFGSDKIEDMDTTLLASLLKVFGDVQNKVKKQVAQFCAEKGQPESVPSKKEEISSADSEDSQM